MVRVPGSQSKTARPSLPPLVFLGISGLVMVAALVWMSRFDDEEPPPLEPVSPLIETSDIDVETIPWDPKVEEWGRIDDLRPEDRRVIPRASLEFASRRVAEHSWNAMKVDPGFARLPIADVLADPASFRGRPVEVVGVLTRVEGIDPFDFYDFKIPEVDATYEGIVTPRESLHGATTPVNFLFVDPLDDGLRVHEGMTVKLQGVMFKLHEVDVDGKPTTGIWVLAKRIYENFDIPAGDDIDLSLLSRVTDVETAEDAAFGPFFTPPLFHLMAYAREKVDDLEARKKAYKGREMTRFQTEPWDHRGDVVEFQGKILRIEHHPMSVFYPQNAAGDNAVDEIWNVYVTGDNVLPITVMYSRRPTDRKLHESQQVRVRGVFYRRWGYRSRPVDGRGDSRGTFFKAPLFVGFGDLEVVDVGRANRFGWLGWSILGFTVLACFVVALVLRRDRSRSDMFREKMKARRRVRRSESSS